MEELKIYHNPRCKHSRAGLEYLKTKTTNYKEIKYISNGISEEDLSEILLKMNKKPSEIIRTQESVYKSNLKGKQFTDEEWINIIIENPNLLQRPIIVGKYKAVIAQPPELADEML